MRTSAHLFEPKNSSSPIIFGPAVESALRELYPASVFMGHLQTGAFDRSEIGTFSDIAFVLQQNEDDQSSFYGVAVRGDLLVSRLVVGQSFIKGDVSGLVLRENLNEGLQGLVDMPSAMIAPRFSSSARVADVGSVTSLDHPLRYVFNRFDNDSQVYLGDVFEDTPDRHYRGTVSMSDISSDKSDLY